MGTMATPIDATHSVSIATFSVSALRLCYERGAVRRQDESLYSKATPRARWRLKAKTKQQHTRFRCVQPPQSCPPNIEQNQGFLSGSVLLTLSESPAVPQEPKAAVRVDVTEIVGAHHPSSATSPGQCPDQSTLLDAGDELPRKNPAIVEGSKPITSLELAEIVRAAQKPSIGSALEVGERQGVVLNPDDGLLVNGTEVLKGRRTTLHLRRPK